MASYVHWQILELNPEHAKETNGLAYGRGRGNFWGSSEMRRDQKKTKAGRKNKICSLKENRFKKEYHNSVMNTTQIAASFLSTGLQTSKELLILNFPLQ